EVADQRAGAGVLQHPVDLRIHHRRIGQTLVRGQVDEFLVRRRVPQEERQAAGQFQVGEQPALTGRRRGDDPVEEVGAGENRRDQFGDAGIEATYFLATLFVELHHELQVRVGDRATEG